MVRIRAVGAIGERRNQRLSDHSCALLINVVQIMMILGTHYAGRDAGHNGGIEDGLRSSSATIV